MHRAHAILIFLFCSCAAFSLFAAETDLAWTIEAPEGADFSPRTGIATATNGVVVKYMGATLTAKKATVNQKTGDVVAEGDVRLQRGDQLWAGQSIQYNFKTRKIVGENFKSGQAPFFVRGDLLVADQAAGVYVGANGLLTTDDYANPGYSIRAKTLIVVPGEYIEARNATVYLDNVPVFYFPYYRRSLKLHPNNFVFTPGYRSIYGPYLLSSYNYYWNERLDGTLHLDARLRRGFGYGPDVNYHLLTFGEGTFKYYYTHDENPGLDLSFKPVAENRQRVWFSHYVSPRTNLTVKGIVRYQSDAQIVRDFFESEYRRNVQPSTFVEANQLWSNFTLDLLVQPRVNPFFETVERLPDLKLTGLRQQIGVTPLFYESESSVGYFRRKFADNITNYYGATRADTFHQVTLPQTFFNWLNFIPRVGGRSTYYSQADGPGAATTEQNRSVFNTGAELTFKASRVWQGAESRFWEVNGLRHIIQPSANYVFVPRPSVAPPRLPQFDTQLPTTRLLPIEFPDYNAIDSIDSQNVVRLGLHNKLQTKRQGVIDNLVNWNLYSDWRIRPQTGQGSFSDLYSDLDLKPFSWLTFTSETRYDLNQHHWNEANHMATLTPNDIWSVNLGHRYLRDNPAFGTNSGNNLIFTSVYYKLNENWAVRAGAHFEARDGTLEEQYYTLYRDLRSWTTALTFRVRENRIGPTDYTAALTFSLKAFPRYGLGDDSNKPELLLGY